MHEYGVNIQYLEKYLPIWELHTLRCWLQLHCTVLTVVLEGSSGNSVTILPSTELVWLAPWMEKSRLFLQAHFL